MRTKNLLMMMAALAMTGCSQNEITEIRPEEKPAIGFNVYTGVHTKGTATDITGVYPGFNVMAIKGGTDVYMASRQVTSSNSGSTWVYTPAAYWPADGAALSFYSYAPSGADGITATSFDDDTTPEISFKIADAWTDMIDLVAAKNENVATGTSVSVKLKHILTRIAFTATTSEDLSGTGTEAFITGLKVLNASSPKFYKTAAYNLSTEAWSAGSKVAADYSIVSSDVKVESSDASAPTSLTGASNYLFCIPVDGLTEGDIQLEVSYKTVTQSLESPKTVTMKVPAGHFAKGTAYSYNFEISLGKIGFTATVDGDWSNGSGNLVPVP